MTIEVDKRLMLVASQYVNKISGLIKAIENLSEIRFKTNSAGASTQSRLKTPGDY